MIQANELRIGNKIIGEDELGTVSSIVQEFNNEPFYIELEREDGMFSQCYEEDLKGIPLTEEWLLKFGFKKDDDNYYSKEIDEGFDLNSKLLIALTGDYLIGTPYEYGAGKCKIQYVHQLQNLYFALTGEELKLQE